MVIADYYNADMEILRFDTDTVDQYGKPYLFAVSQTVRGRIQGRSGVEYFTGCRRVFKRAGNRRPVIACRGIELRRGQGCTVRN